MSDYTNTSYGTGTMTGTGGAAATYNVVSAVFDDAGDAQRAVDWLRGRGVPDSAISLVARRGEDYAAAGGHDLAHDEDEAADHAADAGKGALAGAGIGAAVGALFGLAAFAIPGAGPFITAGALANALGYAGGAAVSGAVVGGTAGALSGALTNWGVNEAEAHYYAGEVERGGTYVGVNVNQAAIGRDEILEAFRRYNGRVYSGS
jgi:hypothetical protein